jgi:hypothetical protein
VAKSTLSLRHSGAMRSIEPGISRFRVRIFDAPRNDDVEFCADVYTTAWTGTIAFQAFNNNLMETAR